MLRVTELANPRNPTRETWSGIPDSADFGYQPTDPWAAMGSHDGEIEMDLSDGRLSDGTLSDSHIEFGTSSK